MLSIEITFRFSLHCVSCMCGKNRRRVAMCGNICSASLSNYFTVWMAINCLWMSAGEHRIAIRNFICRSTIHQFSRSNRSDASYRIAINRFTADGITSRFIENSLSDSSSRKPQESDTWNFVLWGSDHKHYMLPKSYRNWSMWRITKISPYF